MDNGLLSSLVARTLEEARSHVLGQVLDAGLPSSITREELTVVPTEDGTGWRTESEERQASGIADYAALAAVSEIETGSMIPRGLRDVVGSLTAFVLENSSLGERQDWGFMPNLEGEDAVFRRVVLPMMLHYLTHLDDLATSDGAFVAQMAADLELLIVAGRTRATLQLPVSGLRIETPVDHLGIRVRMLTNSERGAWVASTFSTGLTSSASDFVVAQPWDTFHPTTLIEVETAVDPRSQESSTDELLRLALACFLGGIDFASSGFATQVARPRWAGLGFGGLRHRPFPVAGRPRVGETVVTEEEMRAVIEFSRRISPFTLAEASREDIVFGRIMRGSGSAERGLLDFAIALEAILLHGLRDELSFRFAIYGAGFLADRLSPVETYQRLKRIYKIRSSLVHGEVVDATSKADATGDAEELAWAMARKVVEVGWPDTRALEAWALSGPTGIDIGAVQTLTNGP